MRKESMCILYNYVSAGEGLLWMECKALYSSGPRVYLLDSYNWIDFIVLSMYLSSFHVPVVVRAALPRRPTHQVR